MNLRLLLSLCLLFMWTLFSALPCVAQPKTIKKKTESKGEQQDSVKSSFKTKNQNDGSKKIRSQVVLLQVSRLANYRFKSLTFSYEKHLSDFLGATVILGLPVNTSQDFKESNGTFSGVEAGLAFKAYTSPFRNSRIYFQLEGVLYYNRLTPEAYVAQPMRPTFRVAELEIKRLRQRGVLSIGYQFISFSGITIDARAGLTAGRRGLFTEGNVNFLRNTRQSIFARERLFLNRWDTYVEGLLGLSIGYAF